MPASRQVSRINTLEMRYEMETKLGRSKAEFYFCLLTKFLSLKISKLEFNKLCINAIGKENLHLHNKLIRSIVKNATLSMMAPPKVGEEAGSVSVVVPNGYQKGSLQSLCRDFPQSPRKGRTPSFRDRKFKDRPSPLGPQGKSHCVPCEDSTPRIQEQQSASELFSLGSRPPCSDEDSEEVEQAAGSLGFYRKSPLVAPLGVLEEIKTRRKLLVKKPDSSAPSDNCHVNGWLPGTGSLMKRLKKKLDAEGLNMSEDCANLLNCSLDVYIKRLIKPCLELGASRPGNKHVDQGHGQVVPSLNGVWPVRYEEKTSVPGSASALDFRVAMETNPTILGEDWPRKLEKVCFCASEENSGS